MTKPKILKIDAFLWVLFLFLAAVIAFNLLQRDKNRNFGAIAYGGFPQFSLKTIDGKTMDCHRMKSAVWAIHQGAGDRVDHIARELFLIAHTTATGKRHLNILTLLRAPYQLSHSVNQFQIVIQASGEELGKIFGTLGVTKEDMVLLVDQDGVVRGRYDFTSPDEFRSFRQDMLRLL